MEINTLTPAEESLMEVIWPLQPSYMRDIMEAHPEPKPHQNTVSTYLKILVEKGFLTTVKEGRIFKYSAAIPYEVYRNHKIKELISQFFEGSSQALIQTLVDQKFLTVDDIIKQLNIAVENLKTKKDESEKSPIQEFIDELINPKKSKNKKTVKKKKKEKKKKDSKKKSDK